MRALTGGQRALLASGRFRFTGRCECIDQNGVYRDVTNWLGTNWFDAATWTESADQPVSTGTVTLAREDRGISLAPAIGGSPANQLGASVYSPFLVEGRGIRLSCAITDEGVAPVAGDFIEVFVGQYDGVGVTSTANTISLPISDKGAFVAAVFIREKKTYATAEEGVLLENVVQQILDDALGVGAVALYVPVGTGTKVRNVEVDRKSLLEAVRDVALMIGADIRYRYDAAGVSRLTLIQPNRGVIVGGEQTWFAASEYLAIPRLDTSVVDVRNAIRVDFTNADTGKPDHVEVADAASIAKYGGQARWMQLGFAKESTINTPDEALTLANTALADMAWPFSDHDVETFPMYWPAQLGDFYGFRANTKVYDSDQSAGVFGFTHTMEKASSATTLVTKARVVGAFREWQRRSDSEFGLSDDTKTEDTRALALKNFREVRRTPTAVTFGWDPVGDDVVEIWAWGKLSPQDTDPPLPPGDNEDRLWRDTKTETPDLILDATTTEFEVKVPDFGSIQTWELLPVGADAERGFAQRMKVLSVPDVPRITEIETSEGASGLFKDIVRLNVVDPQALGGTLRAWLNHDSVDDADPTTTPDGTIAVAVTPYAFVTADVFTLPSGGTAQLFDNVRIHPGKGKHIYFEFVNSRGISSGVVGFILLSNGGIITPDGQLKDESINRAEQIASSFALPSVYDTLPAVGRENELAVLTTDGKLYRWTGGAWTAEVPAVDISGVLTAGQIADHIIGLTKIATSLAPPEILGALPASPGAGRVALYNGTLYRSTPDGSGWTSAVPTSDLTGTVARVQIALGAINDALLAAGAVTVTKISDGAIETPKLAAGAVTAVTIGAGQVIAGKLGVGAVIAGTIDVGAVTAGTIAAGAVTAGKLDVGAVTAGTIAAGAVSTTELGANAITAVKIGVGEVVAGKLATNAVVAANIQAGAINSTHINVGTLTGDRIAINTMDAGRIVAGTITATALATGAVTAIKMSVTLLSEVSTNAGVIVAGKLQSVDGLRYLDLNATGSNPFLQHPSLTLRSDGTATFGGTVSATNFTGFGAVFSNGLTSAGHLFITGTGNALAFTNGFGPRIVQNGNDLLLSPATSGTTLLGSIMRSLGGVSAPAPIPVVVVGTGAPGSAANYRNNDLYCDVSNLRMYVVSAGAWVQTTT